MMHTITEHIYKLLNGDAQRFPDVVLLDMVVQDKQRLFPHDAFIDAVALANSRRPD